MPYWVAVELRLLSKSLMWLGSFFNRLVTSRKINGRPFSKIKQTIMSWHKNIRPTANTLGSLHFFSSSAIAGIEIYTNMMAKVAGYMYSLSDMATNIRKAISILTNIVKSKDCLV